MSEVVTAAAAALKEKVGTFSSPAKIVIEDEGSIMIDENGVREADEEAEVTMTASAETFQGILSGSVNPTMAFMSGQLKIDGSMGLAMQLGAALS